MGLGLGMAMVSFGQTAVEFMATRRFQRAKGSASLSARISARQNISASDEAAAILNPLNDRVLRARKV